MLATTQAFLNLNSMARSNSAYGVMRANMAQQSLAFKGYNMSMPLRDVFQSERQLTMQKQQLSMMHQIALVWDDALNKLQKKNIKDTFSTFA